MTFNSVSSMLGRPVAFDHIKPLSGWQAQHSGPLTPPIYLDDRPFLSPSHLGYDISRPSSATSTHSAPPIASHHLSCRGTYGQNLQLPALSTLASLAAASVPINSSHRSLHAPQDMSMNMAAALPASTVGGSQNGPPSCQNCATSTTPLWRRDDAGSVLCNACGLFAKLHSRPRPISLKTDVIKSRNRVKTAPGGKKRTSLESGLPASFPDHSHHESLVRRTSAESYRASTGFNMGRSVSPNMTSEMLHSTNIAPQHLFDNVSLAESALHSTTGLQNLRLVSPSGTNHAITDPSQHTHNDLRTRVSELEVINELFKGRIAELERSEALARENEAASRSAMEGHQLNLTAALEREAGLRRRLQQVELEIKAYTSEVEQEEPRSKRRRVSDIGPEFDASVNALDAAVAMGGVSAQSVKA